MAKIAIIKTTGASQADLILAGAYGQIQRVGEGDDAQRQFKIHRDLVQVHSLFAALATKLPSMPSTQAVELDLPEGTEDLVTNQILATMRNRWASLYSKVGSSLGGNQMVQIALEAEGAQVTAKVDDILNQRGLRPWAVPVRATMESNSEGPYVADERDLLNSLNIGSAKNISLDVSAGGVVPTELNSVTNATAQVQTEEAQQEMTQTPAWGSFQGIEADIGGTIIVVAQDEASAIAAAHTLIQVSNLNPGNFPLAIKPARVLATRELLLQDIVDQAADSDSYEDDGDMDDYRFGIDR